MNSLDIFIVRYPSQAQIHSVPIVAFEVNVVGPGNGSNSHFTSGAGTITYGISNGQSCVEGGLPDQCSNTSGSGTPTAETSNAIYGPIETPCCASALTQSISVPVIIGSLALPTVDGARPITNQSCSIRHRPTYAAAMRRCRWAAILRASCHA